MRFLILDVIRTVAIIILMYGHISHMIYSEPPLDKWILFKTYNLGYGEIAVTLFLFLSGLTLQIRYGAKSSRYSHFILKRCLRIYPVYYISLILGIIILSLLGYFSSILSSLGVLDIFLSLTGCYAFAGRWGGPFVGTSWFIGLIVSFYFVFPFISKWTRSKPHLTIFVFLLISAVSRLVVSQDLAYPYHLIRWFPLCRIFEFCLGIYLATILKPSIWGAFNTQSVVLGKTFEFIGQISFPMFLIHFPLLFMAKQLMQAGYSMFSAVALFLIVTVGLSWAAYILDNRFPRAIIFEKGIALLDRLKLPKTASN